MKKHLFWRLKSWGKDDPCERWQPSESGNKPRWPWRGHPTIRPVSASCATGKITKTFWQKGHKLTAAGEASSSVSTYTGFPCFQAQFHNSKKWPYIFSADLTVPRQLYFSSFFPSLSYFFIASQCICCSTKSRSLEWVKPRCLFPSSFFMLHRLMFVILHGVCDRAAAPYTLQYGAETLCSC